MPARAQGKPILIGAAVSLSGIFADGGKYSLEGYQLGVAHVNAQGGVLGRPLELKYYDDQSAPATGVRLYERLINEDKVDLVIGPYGTAISAPAANVAERYKMPMLMSETADVAMFHRGLHYIFQGLGPVQTYLYGVMSIAHDHGFRKLAVIGGDTAFPHSLANAVPEVARGFGQAIVYSEFYPGNASDFSSVVEKVRAADPDVVLAMAFPTDSLGLVRQLKQSNYAPKMFYEAIGASDPLFVRSVGRDCDGTFSVVAWNFAQKTPESQAFVRDYQAMFHREPDYHSASNYSAIHVLTAAVKSAGSVDNQKIRDALATMRLKTLLGTYRVDQYGIQLGYTSYIIQWQKGKQEIVYPGNVATAKPIVPFPAWSGR
ncbi:MAG: amino acid ABC transporter substrate-binding protein [Candidatus Eremiobacteraeota bacterium]|nr:amino acid ABC transporter substrate-binding protein [Candidatus Eremiobacteraeota bacterium]